MKKNIIKDADSLKRYLMKVENPVFGVGTRPYNFTIGAYKLFKHFEILACSKIGEERSLIENKIKITYLDQSDNVPKNVNNYKTYKKRKPLDLFRSNEIIKYLNSFKVKPVVLFNQMPKNLEVAMKKKNYIVISSGYRMFKKYENKINFQRLLDRLGIISPRHMVINAKKIDYDRIKEKVGSRFVIQMPSTALGSGTFFVLKKSDFDKAIKKEVLKKAINEGDNLRITEYIDKSCSPSLTVCVSRFGVLRTGLQRQIIDAEEVLQKGRRSGVYCGHDWGMNKISPDVAERAFEIAEKIGNYFKDKEDFRGIFGIDFILEKKTNQLYPIEANVRLLGSFPVISMLQESAGHPVIQGLQVLEGLNKQDYKLDIEALNKLMAGPKSASHINIYAKNKKAAYVSGFIDPGIYSVDIVRKKINYLRSGVFFNDLKNKHEILLTGGVPRQGRVCDPHSNICKLVSKGSFLNDDDKLNDFAKLMIDFVYKNLALKKIK